MSRTFLVELPNGPAWDPARGLREQPLWDEHAAFVDRLHEQGAIQFAGRLADGSGAITVVEAESADALRRLFGDDPWLETGTLALGAVRGWELYLDARRNGRPPARPGSPAFVVERPVGADWVAGRGPREQPLWDEHAAYIDAIYERGAIVLAGPLVDEPGAVLVLEAENEDGARELLAGDPWIVDADILRVGRVRGWRILLDPRSP